MRYTVKKFGETGLHITLSKKSFKEGDVVEIKTSGEDEVTEERVREIVREEIEGLQQRY